MARRIFICVAILLLVLAVIFGAVRAVKKQQADESGGRIKIAATIFPLYDIVRRIAGDRIETILILPPLASPHTFDPVPSKIKEISGSRLVFKIGGIDDWVDSLSQLTSREKVVTVDRGVVLKKVGENASATDFHYWLDPRNGEIIADNVYEELVGIYPEDQAYFRDNLNRFKKDIEETDRNIAGLMGRLSNKNLIVLHNAWKYFADRYGLEVVGVFEPHPGQEPTPKSLAELVRLARQKKVKAVFSEPQLSSSALSSLAEETGLGLYVLDPLGGVEGRMSYGALLLYNAEIIFNALR
jgi:zinc transport system substrate-binding protein